MIIFTGHASNNAKKRWREKWYKEHKGYTHKAWARFKRKLRLEKRLKTYAILYKMFKENKKETSALVRFV